MDMTMMEFAKQALIENSCVRPSYLATLWIDYKIEQGEIGRRYAMKNSRSMFGTTAAAAKTLRNLEQLGFAICEYGNTYYWNFSKQNPTPAAPVI